METKNFWVLFELELRMVINQWPRLSPRLHVQYNDVAYFKAYFHNFHICVKKYDKGIWHKLSYLVTEDDILGVISKWPSD